MAAEVISKELALDLIKINLSSVVSKYIGETEKNLAKLFDKAEREHSILFFDEVDTLFEKRTELKDEHDRYANLEISYLLQRIEKYSGVVLLALNFKENIDPAFLRRIPHILEFQLHSEKENTSSNNEA